MKNKTKVIVAVLCAVLLLCLIVPSFRQTLFNIIGSFTDVAENDPGNNDLPVITDPPGSDDDPDPVIEPVNPADDDPSSDMPVEPGDIDDPEEDDPSDPSEAIDEFGSYDDKESVALYIHTYGKLPPNYISKADAEDLGWEGGSVEKFAPGKCIGGSYFGNYENLLPKKKGRSYYECDIDTLGKSSRGAKRIIYSNDGLVYYTGDHYESFELLYGDE